jgi:hypothetical protein
MNSQAAPEESLTIPKLVIELIQEFPEHPEYKDLEPILAAEKLVRSWGPKAAGKNLFLPLKSKKDPKLALDLLRAGLPDSPIPEELSDLASYNTLYSTLSQHGSRLVQEWAVTTETIAKWASWSDSLPNKKKKRKEGKKKRKLEEDTEEVFVKALKGLLKQFVEDHLKKQKTE